MNIYDIKNKANEVLRQPQKLFKVIVYIGIIRAMFSALSILFKGTMGTILSLIFSILTVTLGHGIIVATLKVVNNNGDLIDEKEDSLIGIKKFTHLFPTYFLYNLIIVLVGGVIGFVGIILVSTMLSTSQLNHLYQLALMFINQSTISQEELINLISSLSQTFSMVFIIVFVVMIISIYLSLRFGLFNYILQKYDYTGLNALKESGRLMKGNKWTLFKLEFSFLGWMILAGLVSGTISMFFQMIVPVSFLVTFLTEVISTIISTYFYGMKLNVCLAVFYEELDYEDKNGTVEI